MRYVLRSFDGKIVSSFELPQPNLRLHPIDDQDQEYKDWKIGLNAEPQQE